jgi:hypothetical protein
MILIIIYYKKIHGTIALIKQVHWFNKFMKVHNNFTYMLIIFYNKFLKTLFYIFYLINIMLSLTIKQK